MSNSVNSINYILDTLAEKYNVSKDDIRDVEFSIWKGIRTEMAKKEGKDILIANLGSLFLDRSILNRDTSRLKYLIHVLEQDFKTGMIEQIEYLYKWINLNRLLKENLSIYEGLEKRKNRKKGDRGL